MWLVRTIKGSLVHSEPLRRKRDGAGNKATRLGSGVRQEAALDTDTCGVLQVGTEVPRLS